MSTLLEIQFILVAIGILLETMAFSAKWRMRPVAHYSGEEDDAPIMKTEPPQVLPKSLPKSSKRDYYGIEETEPGVAPAQLLRTAKVSYFNDVNVKPSSKA